MIAPVLLFKVLVLLFNALELSRNVRISSSNTRTIELAAPASISLAFALAMRACSSSSLALVRVPRVRSSSSSASAAARVAFASRVLASALSLTISIWIFLASISSSVAFVKSPCDRATCAMLCTSCNRTFSDACFTVNAACSTLAWFSMTSLASRLASAYRRVCSARLVCAAATASLTGRPCFSISCTADKVALASSIANLYSPTFALLSWYAAAKI